MADALLECCCRLVVELLCHITCAIAYGACGAPRRRGLPLNAIELYVGKPSPEGGDCGSCWMCSRSRVLLPEEHARHAVDWGVERSALDELVTALGVDLEKGAALARCCGGGARAAAGIERFVRRDGARWQALLGVELQPIALAPVALRVVLGPRYSGRRAAAQEEALPTALVVGALPPPLHATRPPPPPPPPQQQQQHMAPAPAGRAQHLLAPEGMQFYGSTAAAATSTPPPWAPPQQQFSSGPRAN